MPRAEGTILSARTTPPQAAQRTSAGLNHDDDDGDAAPQPPSLTGTGTGTGTGSARPNKHGPCTEAAECTGTRVNRLDQNLLKLLKHDCTEKLSCILELGMPRSW